MIREEIFKMIDDIFTLEVEVMELQAAFADQCPTQPPLENIYDLNND